jgi:uncharacterized protein
MHAVGYPWPHEVRVALPASYASSTSSFPVLWLTDNALETAIPILGKAELILVGVGAGQVSLAEFGRRRMYDFYPSEDVYPPGEAGAEVRRLVGSLGIDSATRGGGASAFLNFLVDDIRQTLASEYRMDSGDHGLLGFSRGCAFLAYALFARPGAFPKYIGGSGGLYFGSNTLFDMERLYAANHDDLARMFS